MPSPESSSSLQYRSRLVVPAIEDLRQLTASVLAFAERYETAVQQRADRMRVVVNESELTDEYRRLLIFMGRLRLNVQTISNALADMGEPSNQPANELERLFQ